MLTYSRAGLLAIIIIVAFCGLMYSKKIPVFCFSLLFVLLFVIPHTMYERFLSFEMYSEGFGIRSALLFRDLLIFMQNPLFGIGLGKVGTAAGDMGLYPHNYFMYLLLQTGIFGLLIFLWIFVVLFRTCLRLVPQCEDKFFKGLLAGISMYYVMFFVASFFIASGEAFLSAFLFWFLGGVVMILDNDQRSVNLMRGSHANA